MNTPETVAARLATDMGSRALSEASYRLSLAEARFRVSLARTTKDLEAIDHWAAVSKLLMARQEANGNAADLTARPPSVPSRRQQVR